jgi:protein tyrosine kinase modulator
MMNNPEKTPVTQESEREGNLADTLTWAANILISHRWWILTPFCVFTLVGVAFVLRLPDLYTSEATLAVVQQQIPERYVDPAIAVGAADAVNAISQQILSRSRLLSIIDTFKLYADKRSALAPRERLAERLRRDILVEPLVSFAGRADFNAFTVSFTANTPRLAQQVTNRLASLFIEENVKRREGQAVLTTKFLADQLHVAKERLAEQERRLREFKIKNTGSLPEQEQSILGTLTDLRIQLQNTMANLTRAEQQRQSLESAVNTILLRTQSERTALLQRYTSRHPEVLKKDEQIESIGTVVARLRGGSPGADRSQSALSTDPTLSQLKSQVDMNALEIGNLSREEDRLRAEINRYQARLKLTPVREQELGVLLRDYELFRQDYTDLLGKQLKAQLTASAEEEQGGQHLRLIDPPTFPSLPSGPKRLKISLGAAAAGLALGIGLALLRTLLDRSFHTEKELRELFPLPIVLGLPQLRTASEERALGRTHMIEWVAGTILVMIALAAEVYVFRLG